MYPPFNSTSLVYTNVTVFVPKYPELMNFLSAIAGILIIVSLFLVIYPYRKKIIKELFKDDDLSEK
jgi:amino acid permease